MIPSESEVMQFARQYPDDMVHACAQAASLSITDRDILWILAAYEMSKPKVITRNVTEKLNARDGTA